MKSPQHTASAARRRAFASCRTLAFTLVELLVVLAIIALLAGITFGVLRNASIRGDVIAGQQILREHGNAIRAYAADHNGRLPGPLWPGQVPIYEAGEEGRLVVILADYLGVNPDTQEGELIRDLIPPLYLKELNEVGNEPRTFVMNLDVEVVEGGDPIQPFGSAVDNTPPLTSAVVTKPVSTWVMSDVDQEHPLVGGWQASTPEEKLAPKRNVLFFDGHVEAVGDDFEW